MGGFEADHGHRTLQPVREAFLPRCRCSRQKAGKYKAVRGQTRDRQCCQDGTGSGYREYPIPLQTRRSYQAITRIRYQRRPGIGNQRQILPQCQALQHDGDPFGFIMFMQAQHLRSHSHMRQQDTRMPGIFGQHGIHLSQ